MKLDLTFAIQQLARKESMKLDVTTSRRKFIFNY